VTVSDVRIGRQGIYDRTRRLVSYELLFRDHSGLAQFGDGDRATSQVINATFGDFGVERIAGGLPLFINLTRGFLVGELPLPCGPELVVLEVLEEVPVDDELLSHLRRLRSQGYRLAADDFLGEQHRLSLLPLMDYVKIDVQAAGAALSDLIQLVRREAPHARLVVERVEDEATFTACVELGADLFQGYVLQRPVLLSASALSPSQVVCMRLAAALTAGDAAAVDVEPLVAADPGLTVRVLRTANSAASGTVGTVRSLRQALVLLGPKALSSWVLLMLLGGVSTARPEDVTAVLTRAHACAALCRDVDAGRTDVAYTVGLLSGVCDVLGLDATELVATTGVDDEAARALLDRVGPCGRVLSAVVAHERDDADGVRDTGLSLFAVSRAYLDALGEAMRTVSTLVD
jgi:EAL and modified HD-GYP domain-containing signal transduction protein